MKFIGGIQNFKIDNNSISIRLPYYHRVGTGLFSGAEIYVFPKISTIKNAAGQKTLVREIIVSPFHPNDWYTIYEMELIMEDKPGMINSIAQVLKDKSINIHIQESLITNAEQNFSVSLIVDTRDYQKLFKNSMQIEQDMQADIAKSFSQIGVSVEKFLPCKQLRNNSSEMQLKKKTNSVDGDTLKHFYSNNYRPNQIVNRQLIIGKQVLQALFQYTDSSAELQGTVFSDTNEKMVIIRFFNRDQHVVHFDIQHDNKLGAIFQYSSLIKESSPSYNIISCYNRVENTTETAHWYVLLDVSHDIERLHLLFKNITTNTKDVQKLIVHNYSRSIEYLKLNSLQRNFPSQANVNTEKLKKQTDLLNDMKYREVMNELKKMQPEMVRIKSAIKKTKAQFGIVSGIILIACSAILARVIPAADFEKMYLKIAAVAAGLVTLVHFLAVYLELPKLLKNIFKRRNGEFAKELQTGSYVPGTNPIIS